MLFAICYRNEDGKQKLAGQFFSSDEISFKLHKIGLDDSKSIGSCQTLESSQEIVFCETFIFLFDVTTLVRQNLVFCGNLNPSTPLMLTLLVVCCGWEYDLLRQFSKQETTQKFHQNRSALKMKPYQKYQTVKMSTILNRKKVLIFFFLDPIS